jgi:hypothetical protein
MTKIGFFIFVAAVPGLLWFVALFDWYMTLRRKAPLGHHLQVFLLAHPWLAAVLAVVYAAMLAHFFLHIDHG